MFSLRRLKAFCGVNVDMRCGFERLIEGWIWNTDEWYVVNERRKLGLGRGVCWKLKQYKCLPS